MTVTADDLDAALSHVLETVRPAADRDWSVPAGSLEWDCWHTAEHIGDGLLSYAGQLVIRPDGRYVRFLLNADKEATPAEVLEVAETGGRILASTLRTSPPDTRACHPSGISDLDGFAAMGCLEALVHGEDIARGLGLALDPPRDTCTRVLARLFPDEAGELEGLDSWDAMLWCAGRTALPDRPRRDRWRWRGVPLGE